MTTTGVAQAVAILRDFYPGRAFPDESVTAYSRALAPFGDEEVVAAVRKLVLRDSPHPPSVGEIVQEISRSRLEEAGIPTPQVAWEMVVSVLSGAWSTTDLPSLVREALKAMGGKSRISAMEENRQQGTARREFIAAYAYRRDHVLHEIMEGHGVESPTMKGLPVSDKILPRSTR